MSRVLNINIMAICDSITINWLNKCGFAAKSFLKSNTSVVKKFPALYGIGKVVTVLKRVLQWYMPYARWIQSTPSHLTPLRYNRILLFHLSLGLPSYLIPNFFLVLNVIVRTPFPNTPVWVPFLLERPRFTPIPIRSYIKCLIF